MVKKIGKEVNCIVCNKKVHRADWQLNDGRKYIFCSNVCRNKWKLGKDLLTNEGRKKLEQKKGKIKGTNIPLPEKKCLFCKQQFSKSSIISYDVWKNTKYCSQECYLNSQKSIRNKILEEHNYECDKCGTKNNLQIHHNEYLYSNDIGHLSVLCIRCHTKLHNDLRNSDMSFRGSRKIKRAVMDILDALNIDKNDENFRNTPARVSRMYLEMCEGLNAEEEIKEILKTKFPSEYEGMVISKNIQVYSLCPHHLLPVKYTIHVGILFNKECIGLSKIPRLVELLAKRPVLQETLTQNITHIIDSNLATLGSICYIEGLHTCMQARGVKAIGTTAITTSATGKFLNPDKHKNPKDEFLFAIGK